MMFVGKATWTVVTWIELLRDSQIETDDELWVTALDKSLGTSDYRVFTCVHVEYVNMKWQLPINLIRWNLIHKLTFGRNFTNAVGHD